MPIINIKDAPDGWQTDQRYVYCGRPGHGLAGDFGNPWGVRSGDDHESSIAKHRLWLDAKVLMDAEFTERVKHLYGKILVCPGRRCTPTSCHCVALEHMAARLSAK